VTVLLTLKIFIALAGLTLPGYALARKLHLQYAGFAAFPFSALIICQAVTALAICGSKLTFAFVAVMLMAFTALCLSFTAISGESAKAPADTSSCRDTFWLRSALTITFLGLLAVAFRGILYPLGGFDTFIRWNALAKEMLRYGSLSFYPPVTAADFSIYPMPDGFPPLIASVYWWIYAATGTTLRELSVLSVLLQFASILGLTWAAARIASGATAATFSLLALMASPLLIHSVQIGQETGFLIIAVVGQMCFAQAAARRTAPETVTAAAIFAALAALTRDYGPALILPGFFVLICEPATRRLAWRYALIATLIACPWYLRSWLITGSPLYPLTMPGVPNPNPILTAVLGYYGEIFGIAGLGIKEWLPVIHEVILGGSIALLAGLVHLATKGRRLYAYSLSLLLIILLWLWSISKTSGGILYSIKVLAPTVVILALAAGKTMAEIAEHHRRHLSWLLLAASCWGILAALSFPLGPKDIAATVFSRKGEAPEFCAENMRFAQQINSLDLPATGILIDSPYLAVILERNTRFRPVIFWSREVSSVLSSQKSHTETANLLSEKNIKLVAINRASLHNGLLSRIPFYRDGVTTWREVAAGEDWILYAITTETGK